MSNQRFSIATMGLAVMCPLLSVTLIGCLGYTEQPRGGNMHARQSVRYQPAIVETEDYVYYPGYQMYYGSRTHQYYYQDGSAWVARPEPQGISVSLLLSAPSVPMNFHDNPATHHAEVMRTYPKTWSQSGEDHGRRAGQKDSRDDRSEDDRR